VELIAVYAESNQTYARPNREASLVISAALLLREAALVMYGNSCFLFPQTSGYTLTVVASDNGVPPLSSTAMINIDISDVNDNPPVFSQANYSLIIQVRGGVKRRRLIRKKEIV